MLFLSYSQCISQSSRILHPHYIPFICFTGFILCDVVMSELIFVLKGVAYVLEVVGIIIYVLSVVFGRRS